MKIQLGVAGRKMKITNTTCEQRLTNKQTVRPEGRTKVAEVITNIMSDNFVVPPEGVSSNVSIV